MSKSTWNEFPRVKPPAELPVVVFVFKPKQRPAFARLGEDGKFREVRDNRFLKKVVAVSHWAEMPV